MINLVLVNYVLELLPSSTFYPLQILKKECVENVCKAARTRSRVSFVEEEEDHRSHVFSDDYLGSRVIIMAT